MSLLNFRAQLADASAYQHNSQEEHGSPIAPFSTINVLKVYRGCKSTGCKGPIVFDGSKIFVVNLF